MRELTAILHRGERKEGGFWATCLEVPGANGQGETKQKCLKNLAGAVETMDLLCRPDFQKQWRRLRTGKVKYRSIEAPSGE